MKSLFIYFCLISSTKSYGNIRHLLLQFWLLSVRVIFEKYKLIINFISFFLGLLNHLIFKGQSFSFKILLIEIKFT